MSMRSKAKLYEISKYISRGQSPVYAEVSEYKVINQACVFSNKLKMENLKFITQQFWQRLKDDKKIFPDDILVNSTGTGTLGRIGFANKELVENTSYDSHVTVVRIDKNLYWPKYFFYLFQDKLFQNALETYCITGSTNQIELAKNALINLEVEFPTSKAEQARIAEILSTADEAIAQTEALIAKYQRIKTGLMQDLLTRGIDANGNIRSKATHKFVVKNGIEVPEEWEVVRFENLFKTPLRDFGSFSMTNLIEFVNEGIPFIKSEIVFDNFIRYESISFITEKVHTLLFKSWVYPKNILLTKIGTIGRVAIYDGRLGIVNSNAATAKIDLNITKACPEFYSTYLQSEEVKRYFEENVISTPPRINLTEIKEMLVPLPALDEQERIAEKIQTINRILEQETTHLSKLHSLKTGLMQDLLSGRKRLNL